MQHFERKVRPQCRRGGAPPFRTDRIVTRNALPRCPAHLIRCGVTWLRRGRAGATTLECAIAAAAFLGVVGFVTDLGFVLYTQVALDFAVSRAARLLAVDSQQTRSANQAALQTVTVCPVLASFLDCSRVSVSLAPVTDYSSPPVANPPFSPGQGGSLMLLQLSYALPAFAAPLAMGGVFASTQTVARMPYINEY